MKSTEKEIISLIEKTLSEDPSFNVADNSPNYKKLLVPVSILLITNGPSALFFECE